MRNVIKVLQTVQLNRFSLYSQVLRCFSLLPVLLYQPHCNSSMTGELHQPHKAIYLKYRCICGGSIIFLTPEYWRPQD